MLICCLVFKATIVVFQLASLLTFNVVILISGPIVLVLLLIFKKHFLDQDKTSDRVIQAEVPHSRRAGSIRNGSSGNNPPALRYITRSRTRRNAEAPAVAVEPEESSGREVSEEVDVASARQSYEGSWVQTIWRHAKFWVALIVAVGMQVLLMWLYVAINPFVSFFLLLLHLLG